MKLDLPALESWPWEAACVIRGPGDAPKFKDYILFLIFLRRLAKVLKKLGLDPAEMDKPAITIPGMGGRKGKGKGRTPPPDDE